jgi:hypothetical protein
LAQTVAAGVLGGALFGCGAAAEDELSLEETEAGQAGEADLGTSASAITSGTLTTSFDSVVKIIQDAPCTATKLKGTNTFLTAAHCISNEVARLVTMVPNADGSTGQVSLSIPSGGIQKHPSFKLRTTTAGVVPNTFDSYDIAVITTTTPTPNIVGLELPANESPPPVPSTATGIGYGCDQSLNPDTRNGKRQSGAFDLIGGTLDHVLTSTGPDTLCFGDSGGPLLSNANGSIIGIADVFSQTGLSGWSRTASVRSWIKNPKPGNDASLFQNSGDLFFMHNKLVPISNSTDRIRNGLCMVANSNVRNAPGPVSVLLDKCSDPFGRITGKSSGWTIVSASPAGRFVVMNRATSLCLAPIGTTSGSDVQAVACDFNFNTALQKWFFTTSGAGSTFPTLRIKNHSTNLCLRSDGAGTSVGTKVEQLTCDAGANDSVQSWVATK